MSYKAFISYEGSDRPVAEAMAAALKKSGITCWIAPRDITAGEYWMSAIMDAIRQCEVIVVVFSSQTNKSLHVIREVERSIHYALFPVVYRIEDESPRGPYEYALSVWQMFDAFNPVSPESLNRLCELVAVQLQTRSSSFAAMYGEMFDADQASADPLADVTLRSMLSRLAGQMIEQRKVEVDLDPFSDDDKDMLASGTTAGWLRESPSPSHPKKRFVQLANADLRERVLANWIAEHADKPVAEILDWAGQFSPLGDGVARHLVEAGGDSGAATMKGILAADLPAVERIVASLAERFAESEAALQSLVAETVATGSKYALRGLALGAQALIQSGRRDVAGDLLDSMWDRLEATPRDVADPRFLVEIASEKGRLLLRQGYSRKAEHQFRRTLSEARKLRDNVLVGIVSNNLARALLDDPNGGDKNRAEAIKLLEANVDRFKKVSEKRHLAVANNNLGDAYSEIDAKKAESFFRRDVEICRELGDILELVNALDRLGVFFTQKERYDQARQAHEEEIKLCRKILHPRSHARALANLGWNYFRDGNRNSDRAAMELARTTLLQSRELFSSLDEPRLFSTLLENLGRVQFLLGDRPAGVATLHKSIQQYRRCPNGQQKAAEIERELNGLAE